MKKFKKLIILALVSACVVLALAKSAAVFNLFSDKTPLQGKTFSQAFYASDGTLMRLSLSHDDKYRLFVPLEQIPQSLKESVLMYEDRHFYKHYGFNPFSIARGFGVTYIKKSRRMGASTITMQTARMIYDLDTKNLSGKLKQILYALWLEFRYTKEQIFETYLNLAPYSYNIEGAGAASLIYFNTRTQEITLLQALTLAVIPQNPNERNPSLKKGFDNMKAARNTLFNEWIKKYPKDAGLKNFFDMPMAVKTPAQLPFLVPHVVNYLAQRNSAPEVFTTINLTLQNKIEEELKNHIARNKTRGLQNAAAILINYKTMEVEAAVGSADFWDDKISGQVNGFNAQRLAGSTLKTIIYGIAVEKGLIHPATLLKDTKKNFGIYSPENSDRGFAGPVLAEEALIRSRNIPAIELLTKIGYDSFVDALKKGGVRGLKSGKHYSTGLALGSFEISPKEVAGIYAALANRGIYQEPKFVKTDKARQGEVLLSPEASFIALDMLKNNFRPYTIIKGSLSNEYPVYFKTGTSSSFKDAWTAGVFEDYALAVWAGNFSGEGNNYFLGRRAALPLFFNIVKTVEKNKEGFNAKPLNPDNLKIALVDVCEGTGDLPGRFCTATFKAWFIPGVSPIKVSDIHRQVLIDKATGLRACKYDKNTTRAEVYEFWPSEIESLFKEAGIIRKTVPRYLPDCTIEETYSGGNAPSIIFPTKEVVYSFKDSDQERDIIPLKAESDSDAQKIFWFVGESFRGTTKTGETLFIKPQSGNFTVKAVDDLGRSSVSTLTMMIESEK